MVTSTTFREFGLASVFAFGITLANAEARGLAAIVALAFVTIGCRIGAHRVLGGVSGDTLGAIVEVGEALVLVVFALGASRSVAVP